MMTSWNGNIFRVTGPLCGEFTGHRWIPSQRPVTRSFDVFFDLSLNKPLSKQLWGGWFETPSRSLWRHCNMNITYVVLENRDVHMRFNIFHGQTDGNKNLHDNTLFLSSHSSYTLCLTWSRKIKNLYEEHILPVLFYYAKADADEYVKS